MADPFYLTTAIHYPNGRPHIGHAYETIAADVLARFHRQMGREVRFQTGTDEHGLKMAQKARELGITPRALADEMSGHFRSLFDQLDISYDRFIRTSEDVHHRASQAIWRAMEAKGDLYLDRYEGWYSIRDEAYYDASELTEGEGGEKLSPQGTPVEWTEEETWFFRLSNYQDKLLALYSENPDFIRPASRRNEVLRFVEGGLRDLSVSRTSFDWGVKVPGAENHVMYVWVDALTNYLTGLGYPDATPDMAKFWPADLHLIGKDITRFHTVYWPAFLMSADIPLPKQVFAHGFLLNRGQKESKSLGNVTDPGELAERYGVDVLRYFLLREFSFGQDGSYSAEAIVNRSNSELANSFGNLAQRTLSLIFKNCEAALPEVHRHTDEDNALFTHVDRVIHQEMPAAYADLAFAQALEAWMGAVFACNAYIDAAAPWALKKTDPERMQTVLATLYICIAQLAVAVVPVMPGSMAKLLCAMGIGEDLRSPDAIRSHWYSPLAESDFRLDQPQGLFPRLELPAAEGEGA
ncbi:methionine--tRNA ligase [Erythrobacter sp. EC-HK427]|uniref:methionine--tRNA ligase n=1 Tax=Erythrobacter sp. EC-HK427 TaxID=2038396 RepID=UPI001257D415|nr:methionine--tRNA ligase [Erythrobacter sp. EC-HK427]VVT15547.1 Methionine--tRNA ligase [Erythrobacter sp. EC-HK427]